MRRRGAAAANEGKVPMSNRQPSARRFMPEYRWFGRGCQSRAAMMSLMDWVGKLGSRNRPVGNTGVHVAERRPNQLSFGVSGVAVSRLTWSVSIQSLRVVNCQ